jgi:hypothetical protein
MCGYQSGGKALDAFRVGHVDRESLHPRIGSDNFVKHSLPTASDDHRVAEALKTLSQRSADAGSASSDQNGIACHSHGASPVVLLKENRPDTIHSKVGAKWIHTRQLESVIESDRYAAETL